MKATRLSLLFAIVLACLSAESVNGGIFDGVLRVFGIHETDRSAKVVESGDFDAVKSFTRDTQSTQVLSEPQKAASLIEVRRHLTEDGANISVAAENLVTLLDADPENQQGNALLGSLLLSEMNRADLAEAFLYKAVKSSDWADIVSVSHLVFALLRNGKELKPDTALAEKVALEALRRNDKGNGIHDELACKDILGQVMAVVQASKGQWTEASSWYFSAAVAGSRRLGADKARNENVWLKASTFGLPASAYDSKIARSTMLEALKYHPQQPIYVFHLGKALHSPGEGQDISQAAALYRQAIDLDEENMRASSAAEYSTSTAIPEAWGKLGAALKSLGRIVEAHQSFDRAVTIEPNNHSMLATWAKLLCMPEVAHYKEGRLIAARAQLINAEDASVQDAVKACAAFSDSHEL